MEKVRISIFTDPMMGLSYESEPMLERLKAQFPKQLEFRYVMSLLVRDVRDFMTWEERRLPPDEGIRVYNRRLAKIYKGEESIGDLPINMEGFRLFDEEHTSSLPLNLAYKAAELTDPERAEQFLLNLRRATVVDTRPTTHMEEILDVVRTTGMDEEAFLARYRDGSAMAALEEDLALGCRLGIHSLPAYLLEYQGKSSLLRTFDTEAFAAAIRKILLEDSTEKSQAAETEN